ncbi:MAG: hypothetical protein MJB14_12180 [Spirochaetes bacterium]|nr:hypothetical protein [Spirochaetota bacterium]
MDLFLKKERTMEQQEYKKPKKEEQKTSNNPLPNCNKPVSPETAHYTDEDSPCNDGTLQE